MQFLIYEELFPIKLHGHHHRKLKIPTVAQQLWHETYKYIYTMQSLCCHLTSNTKITLEFHHHTKFQDATFSGDGVYPISEV